MNIKQLGVISVLFFSYPAIANVQAWDVNCETVGLSFNTLDGNLEFSAYWKKPAVFPSPPSEVVAGDFNSGFSEGFSFNCPNLKVFYDQNLIKIKSNSYEDVLKIIGKHNKELELYSSGGYRYPNIRKGYHHTGYSFNLESFYISSNLMKIKEGSDLSRNLQYSNLSSQTSIVYSLDNGRLEPLIYDSKVSKYRRSFKKAKVIDIYHFHPSNSVVQRITIDKVNGELSLYKKYPFPKS